MTVRGSREHQQPVLKIHKLLDVMITSHVFTFLSSLLVTNSASSKASFLYSFVFTIGLNCAFYGLYFLFITPRRSEPRVDVTFFVFKLVKMSGSIHVIERSNVLEVDNFKLYLVAFVVFITSDLKINIKYIYFLNLFLFQRPCLTSQVLLDLRRR